MKRKRHIEALKARLGICLVGLLAMIVVPHLVYSQQPSEISGEITDALSGESLPNVTVLVKGTTVGTISDFEGNYTITATSGDILVFSSVGYLSEEVRVFEQTIINYSLSPDIIGMDEVVVVGYGIQRRKLNTGANVHVSGENIQALNPNSAMDALKGLSAGVNITQNSGMPGAGSKVYIRGIGTIDNSKPLYIVDGISLDNIDNLSPSDIESIDILKDAASAAIYGSRAANGVILITTKKGLKNTAPQVSYEGYYGIQNAYKHPQLLNAQQYMEMQDELYDTQHDWEAILFDIDPNHRQALLNGSSEGTNWYELMRNKNAPIQSHSINITGGSQYSVYSLGASYFHQEGILGKGVNSDYERINLRLNTEHTLLEHNGRDAILIGNNLSYTNYQNAALRTGDIYSNDFHNAITANPLLPHLNSDGEYHFALDWYSNNANPIALMHYNAQHNSNNNNTIIGNVYLEVQPVKNLTLRSSYGINRRDGSSRSWTPAFHIGTGTDHFSGRDQVRQEMYSGYTWTFTNTASYNLKQDLHNLTLLVGQEATRNNRDLSIRGSDEGSFFEQPDFGYLYNFNPESPDRFVTGRDDHGWSMLSYFSRLSYDFRETYLLTLVFRADGSSNFAQSNRWGYFPSVSAGWILSNEAFMDDASHWLNFMRIRGSWGQNGNQDIQRFQYLSNISLDNANYFFGPDKTQRTTGSYPSRVPNPDVTWETSEQTNIGADIYFMKSRLQFIADWYIKDTRDWLVLPPSPLFYGTDPAYINGGHIRNTGFEIVTRWNERTGDFNYDISFSMAFNQNKVVDIANHEKIIQGPSNVLSQGTSQMFRAEVGYPVGYFWGYETNGVLQNDQDVETWLTPDDELYFSNQQPGDVRFVDQNDDGKINDDDKVMLGKPHPDFIFGLQLNADYKGVYIHLAAYANTGHQIAKSYRNFNDNPKQNFMSDAYDRWYGEGTSNTKPRLVASHRNNRNISDIYVEDADFVRISNLTIGYDLKSLIPTLPAKSFKFYIASNNLATFTKYSGLDPEVGWGPDEYGWASGIDLGLYPSARSFTAGVSISF